MKLNMLRLFQIIKYAFKYRRRIKAHIEQVKYFYVKIIYADLIPNREDIDIYRVLNHDKDKLKLKNLVRQAFRYIPGPLSDKEKMAIHNVVMEHIKSNKHHCEYWSDGDYASEGNDCTKMEPTYLYEMCADWAATSEENGSGLMDWYWKVVNKKFLFTTEQLDIIKPVCEYLSQCLDPNRKRKDDMTPVKLSTLGISSMH